MDRILVVGASLAGLRAVEALRRKGFSGTITLVGDETRTPYDRPPLSKEVLRGEWGPEKVELRRKGYDDLSLDMRLGTPAVRLDTAAREVELASGERIGFDGAILACGTTPRKLPNQPDLPGLFMLRTLDDALAMRASLEGKPRVCVIGAGFIGSEVAASCVKLGLSVTVIEALPVPLSRSLGTVLGKHLASLHETHGVDLRLGASVAAIEGDGKVERVVLGDGSVVPCDVLCVGIGVVPSTDWLVGSGLALENGIVCDATCETSVPDIFAAGDVANWFNPLYEERMRVEHWTNAAEQAKVAAENLLAPRDQRVAFESAPMFWSDQYGIKIQGAGRPKPDDQIHIAHGTLEGGSFTALYGRAGRLVGVVTFQQPAKLFQYRKLILEKTSWDAALAAAG